MRAALLAALSLLPPATTAAKPAPDDVPGPAPASSDGSSAFLTVEEALELAFPKCVVERGTIYLKEAHKKRVRELAKVAFDAGIVFPYVARRDGKVVGTAYFDTHKVRTLRQTLMVVVGTDGKIARTELLSFAEPQDYIPRGSWYAQFLRRQLDDELALKRGIRGVTGATLTARATTAAARRVLALHQVLAETAREHGHK